MCKNVNFYLYNQRAGAELAATIIIVTWSVPVPFVKFDLWPISTRK